MGFGLPYSEGLTVSHDAADYRYALFLMAWRCSAIRSAVASARLVSGRDGLSLR